MAQAEPGAARVGVEEEACVRVVFFDDMRGSTALKERIAERSDEEAFHALRREHDELVSQVVSRGGAGQVIKSTGDGVIALFDRPSLAVERALEIQELLQNHPHLRVRIGIDMGEIKLASVDGRAVDVFGRHVDWAARATALANDGHICVTRPVYTDAFSWITKQKIAWKAHGLYRTKRGEPPLELFEPYNANVIRPSRRLRGDKIDGDAAKRAAARAPARPSSRASAEEAAGVAVVRPWEMVARDGREFARDGGGAMYWFRVPLGGVSYPEGFRSFLQPALENDRITKIRFVLDATVPPIRRVWDDLVIPLVTNWAENRGRPLRIDERDGSGLIVLDDTSGRTLSWIFVDLSREFTPCFKVLVPDLDSEQETQSEAQIFLSTAARTVRLSDGTEQVIRVPDAVLRIRRGQHDALLHALNAVANQWDSRFLC
ncbi:MAG: adenylate/guanylate cyclase domain-containing protein [Thermoleophilia bacterium]|nr:adenylate/guanylate cyclase domain-containing protein [Thermoleophilia bacterium]